MTNQSVELWYQGIFSDVVTEPDYGSDRPVPWFTHKIWRDLQWTGYVGQCLDQEKCLAFGLNLEYTPTWRHIRGRLEAPAFQEILSSLHNIEWRWHGRPRQRMPNPPFEGNGPWEAKPPNEVVVEEWLRELDDILEGRRRWRGGSLHGGLIRPHLQLMRCVGEPTTHQDRNDVAARMRAVMAELQPVVSFLTRGRA